LEVIAVSIRAAVMDRFKEELLQKRRALANQVRETNASSLETGSDGVQDSADQAMTAYTKEFLLSVGDADRQVLRQVDAALEKIRRKQYGVCERCGEPIGEKRLEALPFVPFCIACQEEEERRF